MNRITHVLRKSSLASNPEAFTCASTSVLQSPPRYWVWLWFSGSPKSKDEYCRAASDDTVGSVDETSSSGSRDPREVRHKAGETAEDPVVKVQLLNWQKLVRKWLITSKIVRRAVNEMAEMGLRFSAVQAALRNCTRDEGRSFEVGNQVLISSHRKLLLSKAMVVNVAEKSEIRIALATVKCPTWKPDRMAAGSRLCRSRPKAAPPCIPAPPSPDLA